MPTAARESSLIFLELRDSVDGDDTFLSVFMTCQEKHP